MNFKSLFGLGKRKKLKEDGRENGTSNKGIIGEYYENDFPVIVKFVDEFPDDNIRARLPMLTVVSWKYDGSERNGMPPEEVNDRMIDLEEAIANSVTNSRIFKHAYSRTGNNLKEFVYYSRSQDDFMEKLNKTLSRHEIYPIEINFYEDREWREFKKLLNDFLPSDESDLNEKADA